MSDVNAFIDAIGKDVSATVAPRVQSVVDGIGAKAVADYVPKVSAFANQLVKEIVAEQSAAFHMAPPPGLSTAELKPSQTGRRSGGSGSDPEAPLSG